MSEEKVVSQKIESETVTEPVRNYLWWIIGGIILLAVIVFAVIYFVKKNKDSSNNPLDDIRQAFPATSTPATSTPSGISNLPPISTSTSPTQTPTSSPPVRSNNQTPTYTAPQYLEYTNAALGFGFSGMPSSWEVDQSRSNATSIAFINNALRKQGFVEVYANTSGETLDSLESTLRGSPSVASVSRTTLAGQPALYFRGTTTQQNGIATLYNGKVYYLRGDLASADIAQMFRFQ